jgi:drug/metabolite transporter (DMT)-like permease
MAGLALPSTTRSRAVAAGLLAAVLWGVANVVTKGALSHFEPLPLLLLQLLGSNLLLWPLLWFRSTGPISRHEFVRLGWPGLIQPGLAFVLGILGLALTTASNDALIWASESVMVLGLGWLCFGRRPDRSLVLLAATALAGVALATSNPTGEGTPISLGGNALILLAVGCGALYTLITEGQVQSRSPLALLALHQLWGLGLVLLVWVGMVLVSGRSGFPATLSVAWLVALGSGMLQFALPFLCFLIALESLGAGRVSSFLTIPPIVTIIGARIFLGERLALVQLIGGAVVLLAVAAIQRPRGPRG